MEPARTRLGPTHLHAARHVRQARDAALHALQLRVLALLASLPLLQRKGGAPCAVMHAPKHVCVGVGGAYPHHRHTAMQRGTWARHLYVAAAPTCSKRCVSSELL